MLGYFRKNEFSANLLLLLYVAALHASIFFFPHSWEVGNAGSLSWEVYSLVGTQGWLPDLLAALLVFIHAITLNMINVRFRLSREATLYPGVFYVLLSATLPGWLHLSPVLMGNTFLIFAIWNAFASYKQGSNAGVIFNIGFWIGVASLFYFANIVFVLLGIIGLNILRPFRLNEVLMILIGAVVPFFLAGTLYFIGDDLTVFFQKQFTDNLGMFDFVADNHWSSYSVLTFFGVLILVTVLSINIYLQKQKMQSQKYIHLLYNFLAVSILTLLLQKGIQINHLLIMAIPFALLLPFNFLKPRMNAGPSTVHLFWFFAVLGFQIFLLTNV